MESSQKSIQTQFPIKFSIMDSQTDSNTKVSILILIKQNKRGSFHELNNSAYQLFLLVIYGSSVIAIKILVAFLL